MFEGMDKKGKDTFVIAAAEEKPRWTMDNVISHFLSVIWYYASR